MAHVLFNLMRFCIALMLGILCVTGTYASDNQIFACQNSSSAGFDFDNGKWKATEFRPPKPFFLKLVNGKPDLTSVAKLIGGVPQVLKCGVDVEGLINCAQLADSPYMASAETLIFSPKLKRGAISVIGGAIGTGENRDSLVINVFTCEDM